MKEISITIPKGKTEAEKAEYTELRKKLCAEDDNLGQIAIHNANGVTLAYITTDEAKISKTEQIVAKAEFVKYEIEVTKTDLSALLEK